MEPTLRSCDVRGGLEPLGDLVSQGMLIERHLRIPLVFRLYKLS